MSTTEDSGYAPRKESLKGFGPTNTMTGFTGAKGLTGFDMTTNEPRRDERQRDTWLEATRPHMDGSGEGDGGPRGFGAHPYKVINATDEDGPKVRVLPGACNFGFPTVGGSSNEYFSALDHLQNAPRLSITATCFVVLKFSSPSVDEPFPGVVNLETATALTTDTLPVAVVLVQGGRIASIRQLLFDYVGATSVYYANGMVRYAITR